MDINATTSRETGADAPAAPILALQGVGKCFTLHQQGGLELPVLGGVSFSVSAGECVALDGPSGAGKSTLLKLIHGNYRATAGSIRIDGVETTTAAPRTMIRLRRHSMGYVSQFLRTIPRVSTLDVVAEPLAEDAGDDAEALRDAQSRARELLMRLRIPARLWHLPPATFSGGEQQRVNIARGLVKVKPLLLMDEPTASLDAANRTTVIELIRQAREGGAAVVGIFHDRAVRDAVATRVLDMAEFR